MYGVLCAHNEYIILKLEVSRFASNARCIGVDHSNLLVVYRNTKNIALPGQVR